MTPTTSPNGRTPPPTTATVHVADPHLATRIAALQAAATFAAGVVLGSSTSLTSADVLRVAEAFTRWLEGEPAT